MKIHEKQNLICETLFHIVHILENKERVTVNFVETNASKILWQTVLFLILAIPKLYNVVALPGDICQVV